MIAEEKERIRNLPYQVKDLSNSLTEPGSPSR